MPTPTKITRKTPVPEDQPPPPSPPPFAALCAPLKGVLTIPEIPGFKGCRPCLSGLDRLVIEDLVVRGMR